ncbi:hypothetical protein Tco_1329245 [Tanacetum coccineum]
MCRSMSKIYAEPGKIGSGNRRDNPRYPVSPRLPKINVTRWLRKVTEDGGKWFILSARNPSLSFELVRHSSTCCLFRLSKSEDVPSYTIDTWTMNFHMEYLMALTEVWYPACYTRIGLKTTGAKLKIMCSISLLKFTFGITKSMFADEDEENKARLAKFVSAASADPQEEQKKKAWALSCDDDEVRVVAICGPAVIGKTKDQCCCFLPEVKSIFGEFNGKADSYHQGTGRIEKIIRHQRVLLVIDDVDSDKQVLNESESSRSVLFECIQTKPPTGRVQGGVWIEKIVLGGQGSIKDTAARLRCFRSVQHWEWALKDLMHNSSW